ncbi:FtsK/SpoIIIE family DNA translocase [Desulfopila aestuarii]|uniref:DNA segregation ATPase FtsK/SpoIIIE, S-DNA-T family n=1 Tax=Desulfopila aestuarii DSM 18488 TaxID=1121416 RepID=A0A1M7Y0G1_9BACT|nr:DNA translocase FtsK 4TM domain-containing protein [Desulfopila aestuarii]SHO45043.1 DNA segregation ATPase FtsK/SpoIIIE, S-DNA-T family [Desulfopila aestuarii DSM 18488]
MTQKTEATRPGFKQESAAVLGIFVSLFLFLSLLSATLQTPGNWCGEIGHLIAQVLIGFVGWGAYLLAVLTLAMSFLFFSPRMSFERLPQVTLGLTGAVISFCGLLSALAIRDPEYVELGGFLGRSFFTVTRSLAGNGGTLLVLGLIFLISLMLSVQFSPYQLMGLIGRMVKGCGRFLVEGFTRKKSGQVEAVVRKEQLRAEKEVRPTVESPVLASRPVPVVKELPKKNLGEEADEKFAATPLARGDWKLPPLSLLTRNEQVHEQVEKEVYYKISKQLEQKLKNFGVSGNVVGISPGPVVTTYEFSPAPGVKINKIAGLADDLALGLKARSVRVVGSIPGKAALGIEIPNEIRQIVYIRDLLSAELYRNNSSKLTIALGLDVVGNLAMGNLAKMPHLLIAGATGAGKSVGINTIIASILYNATPDEVRFLMIDPKRIELSGYEGIPHLLHPVVVDPKLASRALNWAVREMERRYRVLEEAKVKSFDSYNETTEEKLPYIVIIVDELADLMMVASKDVEAAIARLAQMARAAGIHLILATQRPSVDVLTGLIKANFPTRISFKVSSKIDSRTILDTGGAEHLLGSGDMLYLAPGSSDLQRIHGAYISEKETAGIVDFLKKQGESSYDDSIIEEIEKEGTGEEGNDSSDYDERYDEAVQFVTESGQASISAVQRRLRVGYNRAARMIETMEKEGIVGPADGAKPREVLVRGGY